jgi:hypothetical protein
MREVCNAEWDDIQDMLKEQAAEIERLKSEVQDLLAKATDHRFLHRRAADALENTAHIPWGKQLVLISELRKAGAVID